MWRGAPGVSVDLLVVVVSALVLADGWLLGGLGIGAELLLLFAWPAILAVCLIRAIASLRRPRGRRLLDWVRIVVCPVLLVAAMLLYIGGYPLRLRFGWSESELTAYARTVQSRDCDYEEFESRRVGLFDIQCAELTSRGWVALNLSDGYSLVWAPPNAPAPDRGDRLAARWFVALAD
jgi:hypothetical protein